MRAVSHPPSLIVYLRGWLFGPQVVSTPPRPRFPSSCSLFCPSFLYPLELHQDSLSLLNQPVTSYSATDPPLSLSLSFLSGVIFYVLVLWVWQCFRIGLVVFFFIYFLFFSVHFLSFLCILLFVFSPATRLISIYFLYSSFTDVVSLEDGPWFFRSFPKAFSALLFVSSPATRHLR